MANVVARFMNLSTRSTKNQRVDKYNKFKNEIKLWLIAEDRSMFHQFHLRGSQTNQIGPGRVTKNYTEYDKK